MERLTDRSEIIDALLEKVQYSAALKIEADLTPDTDPIQGYAEGKLQEAVPLALMAIALTLGSGLGGRI